jgi:DNA repair exonuclease SbcCD nuclease subunit
MQERQWLPLQGALTLKPLVPHPNTRQERHLPPFLDLVVWGHEHECKPEAEVGACSAGAHTPAPG